MNTIDKHLSIKAQSSDLEAVFGQIEGAYSYVLSLQDKTADLPNGQQILQLLSESRTTLESILEDAGGLLFAQAQLERKPVSLREFVEACKYALQMLAQATQSLHNTNLPEAQARRVATVINKLMGVEKKMQMVYKLAQAA